MLKAFESNSPAAWSALGAHAVYRGSGQAGKLAFHFPGQGSQYVNMLKDLCEVEPLAAEGVTEVRPASAVAEEPTAPKWGAGCLGEDKEGAIATELRG